MKKIPLSDEQISDASRLKALYEAKKKELGLSQEVLAERLGMGQSAVAQLLNAKNAINVSHAAKFAEILEIAVDDFSPILANEITELAKYTRLVNGDIESRNKKPLTKQQQNLLELFDSLPSEEADRFLREMKARSAHFNALFAEMLAKRGIKAS
ncbi:helix-turn-helix domain-containing protein [Xenorhabdus sp. Vera]|uniref:helix-turn-helix domain-containing protein n=1 Tax=Xenorhabdus koppenhoeferi TaxID=351659 RepID=UPI0019C28882|nr:helix-turn-helix domain-containing protein [Xenorhabdus sp. Vera]MBD2811888.1 helix-turn-helix domain-containing protein [Xenorhabdus sp. Vera]